MLHQNIKNIKIRINNILFHFFILMSDIVSLLFDSEFFIFHNIVKKLMLCNYNVLPRYSDEMGSAFSGNFQLALQYICRNFALISE